MYNSVALEILAKLGPEKVSLLHSAKDGKSILAIKAIDEISCNSVKNFKKFTQKNEGKLLIGYISYDCCYELLEIKQKAKDDLNLPKIHFRAFSDWIEIENNKVTKGAEILKVLKVSKPPKKNKIKSKNFTAKISKKEYDGAYKRIAQYIIDGDIYQVNLTHRLEGVSKEDPRKIFAKIVEHNPVNYLAYIEGDGFEILSASPERFISIQAGKIQTQPIKGTRPRGKNQKEDEKLVKELIESKKEAAELNMIADLLRNDLGKIAKTGTVKVEGHRLIKKCPSVWHTYSHITAEIATSPVDALISMLPGGSITGCPKKRAVEVIDELEVNTRGIYTGVIGYIDPAQNLDFNIAIRTVVKKGDKVYLQVGGGIVLDSTQKDEYQETLDKAKSFMKIL